MLCGGSWPRRRSAQRPAHDRQDVLAGRADFGPGPPLPAATYRLPLAIMRLRMLQRHSVRFFVPTTSCSRQVAEATPPGQMPCAYRLSDGARPAERFGHVHACAERHGVPAISPALAQSADGMPVGAVLSA